MKITTVIFRFIRIPFYWVRFATSKKVRDNHRHAVLNSPEFKREIEKGIDYV